MIWDGGCIREQQCEGKDGMHHSREARDKFLTSPGFDTGHNDVLLSYNTKANDRRWKPASARPRISLRTWVWWTTLRPWWRNSRTGPEGMLSSETLLDRSWQGITTKGSAKCWHETKQDISPLNLLWDRLSEESSWEADLEGETIVLDLLTTSDLDLVTSLLELFDLSGFTFLGLSFSAELPTSTKLL